MHDPTKGPKMISKGYPRGEKMLLGPYTTIFGPNETYQWFSSRVALKTEADGRVFPVSDRSESIVHAMQDAARYAGVEVRTRVNVRRIEEIATDANHNSVLRIHYTSATATADDNQITGTGHERGTIFTMDVDKVIMATGSSRNGYDIIRTGFGHTIIDPNPSLFSFKIDSSHNNNPNPITSLSGISVPNVTIKLIMTKAFRKENKDLVPPNDLERFTQEGPLLVTHQGLSGPAVLRMSAFAARILAVMKYEFEIEINWLPELSESDILNHFMAVKSTYGQRTISKFPRLNDDDDDNEVEKEKEKMENNADRGNIPSRLWGHMLAECGIDPTSRWATIKNDHLRVLASQVGASRMRVNGRGQYRDEFVTAGGVCSKEVDFSRMKSKKNDHLYLCGEILDVDGITGGYNFQSAWTSGYIAGTSCAKSLLDLPPLLET